MHLEASKGEVALFAVESNLLVQLM